MTMRYAELLPDQLADIWRERPIAYCAWGALEWHGPHLPLGLDGLVAERFVERLADQMGGVVLPTIWLPITALPHPASISIHTGVVKGIWHDLLDELHRAGARIVCMVTGHYAQGHEIEMYHAATNAMRAHQDFFVLAATPLEPLGDGRYLDHAGRWETAQLMAARPDLVRLDKFPGMNGPKQVAVLGEDPRSARAEEGEAITRKALTAWASWIDKCLQDKQQQPLIDLYDTRIADNREYVRRYYSGSWEEAAQKWWAEL